MDLKVLNELTRYVEWEGDPNWVGVPADPTVLSRTGVGPFWQDLLTAQITMQERVSRLWSGLEKLMPRSRAVFAEKSIGHALLRTRESTFSLVYLFEAAGDLTARRGYLPAAQLPPVSSYFPVDLKPLYGVHDGIINLMSYDGGPLPTRQWKTLVDKDTGEASLVKIALDGSEAFGFDISESPCLAYVVRPDEEEVEQVEDVWAFLDDLLASPLEDL
jgi:hypothetical protein